MSQISLNRGLQFERNKNIEITIAPNAGACFGVVRAIKLGHRAALTGTNKKAPVYSFGPLIHNGRVVAELQNEGVTIVNSVDEAKEVGTVILRSHGVPKASEKELKRKGFEIVDATCPLVKKPQRIARSVSEKGLFLVIVGDANHPEIKGVLSYFGKANFLVTYDPSEVDSIPSDVKGVGVIAQTTIEVSVFNKIVERLKERFSEVLIYNTICDATSIRQNEATQLAQSADVLIVIGGKNSSNTCKLVKICREFQKNTYHIEEMEEIDPQWFLEKYKVGVTGGASTPHEYVDKVGEYIADLIQKG